VVALNADGSLASDYTGYVTLQSADSQILGIRNVTVAYRDSNYNVDYTTPHSWSG
jgi:hypothetical protein